MESDLRPLSVWKFVPLCHQGHVQLMPLTSALLQFKVSMFLCFQNWPSFDLRTTLFVLNIHVIQDLYPRLIACCNSELTDKKLIRKQHTITIWLWESLLPSRQTARPVNRPNRLYECVRVCVWRERGRGGQRETDRQRGTSKVNTTWNQHILSRVKVHKSHQSLGRVWRLIQNW